MNHKAVAVLAALAAMAAALVLALPAGAAGNAGSTVVSSFDPTGAVFTCPGTDYTALGGTVRTVIHDSLAANGTEHVTGTTSPLRSPMVRWEPRPRHRGGRIRRH
jgi:hypothetical protein